MNAIKLLLVEDDQLDVMDIKRALSKMDILYNLKEARNGEEALTLLNDGSLPDIMLIDINMPKMNGLELLSTIRNDPRWKNLKCFIVTTSNERTDRARAEALGVSGYIVKPIKLNTAANMDTFNLMIDLINFNRSSTAG